MKIDFPECGKIVGTHGCRGDVRIESYCDTPEILASLKTVYIKDADGMRALTLNRPRVHGGGVIAGIPGVADMNAAEALRGTVLYARRDDLPLKAGAALFREIVGLPVIDAGSGRVYGTVTDVTRGAASDLYTVRTDKGDVLFPAVPAFIRNIDIEKGVFVTPIPGLFGDAEEIK